MQVVPLARAPLARARGESGAREADGAGKKISPGQWSVSEYPIGCRRRLPAHTQREKSGKLFGAIRIFDWKKAGSATREKREIAKSGPNGPDRRHKDPNVSGQLTYVCDDGELNGVAVDLVNTILHSRGSLMRHLYSDLQGRPAGLYSPLPFCVMCGLARPSRFSTVPCTRISKRLQVLR